MRFVDTNSDCICLNTTLMLSSMLVFVLWKPYSTSFHAKTLTELTLQTFSNKQRSFKSFPMHIHNVTLVKISLERRPRAFVHSFGHAKHRLLPSQIPYYSYARNLVSLDHVNSTFSQLVVFRLWKWVFERDQVCGLLVNEKRGLLWELLFGKQEEHICEQYTRNFNCRTFRIVILEYG